MSIYFINMVYFAYLAGGNKNEQTIERKNYLTSSIFPVWCCVPTMTR
jgi:hypothetical protein